jgi:hypothetical protein
MADPTAQLPKVWLNPYIHKENQICDNRGHKAGIIRRKYRARKSAGMNGAVFPANEWAKTIPFKIKNIYRAAEPDQNMLNGD